MSLFFAESAMIAVLGIIFGLVIGGFFVWYTAHNGIYMGDMGATGMILGDIIYANSIFVMQPYLRPYRFWSH